MNISFLYFNESNLPSTIPMIVITPKFLRILQTVFRMKFKLNGLAIFPIIFVADKASKKNLVLINHERIHFRQQLELLFVGFIIWYYIAMFRKGYRGISFEREAYENQEDLDYLKNRPWFSFFKYKKKEKH